MPNACWPSTYAEYFPTASGSPAWRSARSSASLWRASRRASLSALTDGDASKWYAVALFAVAACVVSGIAVITGPARTHEVPIEELGSRNKRRDASVLTA